MSSEESVAEVGAKGTPEGATVLRLNMGLLSEQELSVLLGVQVRTLQKWRCLKTGPDFVRLGKVVFYRRSDIEKWIEFNVVVTKRMMND